MKSRLFLPWSLLVGLFFLTSNAEAARATTLILGKSKPEPKIDTPPTGEEENVSVSVPATSNLSNETINVGNVTKLTGVPQIDYIYDPNLPRELNGYNLTDYPFYNSVPEDIDFKCDGLHDGFYASVPHKCQVYHHCLFGTRYDFLCANYTAFDQKTFICHFASEVDCKNSPRYFNRNEALYKATTTTTVSPFGAAGSGGRRPQSDSPGGRRRRPYRRRKPSYEYYDEYEDLGEDDYYDDGGGRRRKRPRPFNGRDSYDDAEEEGSDLDKALPPSGPNKSVFDRPRIAPKIRRPVPVNERDKYDYSSDSRAIVKEPPIEKKRQEDSESANRKPTNNKGPDYYESTGGGNLKNKEPDTERDREREHKGDEYESDRERERERDRDRERERDRDERPYRRPPKKRRRPDGLDDEYDEYDDVRRYRNRNRPRYEEYSDYEYDERPYRRNRDQEYRIRDHDYDRERPYRNRDPEYDRPRNRDRLRDDDRPVRNRDVEDRPVRNRDEERPLRIRDDDRPIRNREPEKGKDQDDRLRNRNRNRDDERHYYSGDEDRFRDEGKRTKEVYRDDLGGKVEEERPYTFKEEDEYGKQPPSDESKYRDRNRSPERPPRYRDSLDKFPKSRPPAREVDDTKTRTDGRPRPNDQADRPFRNGDRGVARPVNGQRPRLPSGSSEEETSLEDLSKPVPASRPSYISKPSDLEARKQLSDPNARKPNNFKRPYSPRAPSVSEESSEQVDVPKPEKPFVQTTDRYEERPYDRPNQEPEREQPQAKFIPPEDIRTIEQLNEKLQPIKPGQEQPEPEYTQPRLKVPHEDSVTKEELAPRAPKFPQTSPRRRPFLPSRNGNANLPRNLLPVGVKALQTPRGFQAQNNNPEEEQPKGNYQEKDNQDQRYQYPNAGGLEFRAKVSTAIGVDQPKLTQFFQDVQSSSELELPEYDNAQNSGVDADYYSSVPEKQEEKPQQFPQRHQSQNPQVPDYNSPQFRPENLNFRPTLKPADFPQLPAPDAPPSHHNQDKNLEQTFKNRPLPSAINQQFNQQFTTKPPAFAPPKSPPQFQSFYSENPKFQTTIKVPEPFPYKPPSPDPAFSPAFPGGLRPAQKSEPPQENLNSPNLKFPSQGENLDDTEEYDVSLNDALQPISTLHPRNVHTGVYLTNWQRPHHQPAGFKRRLFQVQDLGEKRNVPNPTRNPKPTTQRQASSNLHSRYIHPPFLHSLRPSANNGNYFTIFTQ